MNGVDWALNWSITNMTRVQSKVIRLRSGSVKGDPFALRIELVYQYHMPDVLDQFGSGLGHDVGDHGFLGLAVVGKDSDLDQLVVVESFIDLLHNCGSQAEIAGLDENAQGVPLPT